MSSSESRPVVHVVAAAVMDANGRVLIAQRPAGKHLAGGWEFPGGKLEPGEERAAGLARELKEELGITIATPRPLMRVQHAYPSRDVLLDMWVVKRYVGEPQGLDGQALRWCAQEDLPNADLLPADKPIVRALRLPERLTHVLTPDYKIVESTFPRQRFAVDEDTHDRPKLFGTYCKDVEDAALSAAAGADFLVISVALQDGELADLCAAVTLPVFALGIKLEEAWALGASGCNELGAQLT
ncbi:MAG: 8-oxo-dGTP diphosphatase MutT [Gammaproteobacteria bacterium]